VRIFSITADCSMNAMRDEPVETVAVESMVAHEVTA